MKHLFYIFPLFFSFVTCAQESKFQIGITGSVDIAYRSLFIVEDLQFTQGNINYRNDFEIPKMGYSGGLHFAYQMRENFKIGAGIQYSNMGYKLNGLHLVYGLPFENIDPRGRGFIHPQYLQNVFNFHYVELPVGFQYELGKNKWKPTLAIGLSPGYLASATKTSMWSDFDGSENVNQSEIDVSLIERFSLMAFANAGVNYQMNETWSLQISGQFRFNAFSVFDEPISTNLWNAGLQLGCFYSL